MRSQTTSQPTHWNQIRRWPALILLIGVMTACGNKEVSTAQPQTKEPTPVVQTTPTPEPTPIQPDSQKWLQEAAQKAESAKKIFQTAVSKDDWDLATSRWESAITILKQINQEDSNYELAQTRLQEYEAALKNSKDQQIDPGDTFAIAMQRAMDAAQQGQTARSAADWQLAAQAWTEAINLMKYIPSNHTNYQTAQQKVIEYSKNLTYVQQQSTQAAAIQPTNPTSPSTYTSAGNASGGNSSSDSGSGNCDYPWQTDSLGRACGDRAASIRPGGRLGGTGSSGTGSSGSNCHYVSGYTRSNGTRVRGHRRCR